VPVKIVPLGTPITAPLPVMVNVPPAPSVPPFAAFPVANAPVVKVTAPRLLPKIAPYLVITSPLRDKPVVALEMVPPSVERSILLADTANGSAKQSNIKRITRLIVKALLNLQVEKPTLLSLGGSRPT
jgi:hypothetical protein